MANLKRYASRRTDDEWYRIIMDCRKSGLSDTRWRQLNDIRPTTFFTAVKRLRDSSYSIPERTADDIYDLTNQTPEQELEKLCPWNPECQSAINKLFIEHQKAVFELN